MTSQVDSSFSSVNTDALSGRYDTNVITQAELEAYIAAVGGEDLSPDDIKKIADYIARIFSDNLLSSSDGKVGFGQRTWDGWLGDYIPRVVDNYVATGSVYLVPDDADGLCKVDYSVIFCIDDNQDGYVSEGELKNFIKAEQPGLTDDQASALAGKIFDQLSDDSSSGGDRSISIRSLKAESRACKLSLLLNIMDHPEKVAASTKYTNADIKDVLFTVIDANGDQSLSRPELKKYYLSTGKTPAESDALVSLHFGRLNDNRAGGISVDEFTVAKKILSGNVKAYDYVAPQGELTTDSIFIAMDTDLDGSVDKFEMTSYYLTKFDNDPIKARDAVNSVFGSIASGQPAVTKLTSAQLKEGGGLSLMNMMEGVVNNPAKELYSKQADGGAAKWDTKTKSWKDVKSETWKDYLASNQKDAAYTVDTGAAVAVVIGDASKLGAPKRVINPPKTEPPMQGDFFIKVGESYVGVKKQGEGANAYYDVFEYAADGTLKSSYTGDPHVDENGDGKWDWHFSNDSSFVLSNGATVSFGTEQWGNDADVKVIDSITVSTGSGSISYDSDTV